MKNITCDLQVELSQYLSIMIRVDRVSYIVISHIHVIYFTR